MDISFIKNRAFIKKTFTKKRIPLFILIIMLLSIPLITLFVFNAQTSNQSKAASINSVEPESGTLSNYVTIENDPNASGGQYVKFPTAASPTQATNDWWGWDPNSTNIPPLLPVLPWHNNTGVWRAEDRAALTVYSGSFTTSSNNQVIDRMEITGDLNVNNTGVIVKRSWVHGRIVNNTSSPVTAIHIDLGDGKAGDYMHNGTKGDIHIYRSNIYGVTDGVMTTPGHDFVLQDNFIHDLRYAHDSGQPGGNTHNDGFQVNSTGVTGIVKHNTFWLWSMNNMTEKETATRDSGPNWTDKGDPLTSTGYSGGDGTPENGLVNSGIMVGASTTYNPTLKIDSNLFRGHVYYYLNIQNGYIEVTNNLFAQDEYVSGRSIVAGRANIDVWSNNKNYKTSALIAL